MERFDLTAEQAAGVFGNLGTESAGFMAFHEKGQPEGKGGYGWAQWTADRRIEFFDFCKRNSSWNLKAMKGVMLPVRGVGN